jgi:hypothetical protein
MNSRNRRQAPLYPKFVWSLVSGRKLTLPPPTTSGDLNGWKPDGLRSVIEIASAQLHSQRASLDRLLSRAQFLFTALLALLALLVGLAPGVWESSTPFYGDLVPRALLLLSAGLLVIALLGAAALIAVRKEFDAINAAVLSQWSKFDLERLAREYAESVGTGEQTNNAHLTVFGTAVRLTLYGALALGAAWASGFTGP